MIGELKVPELEDELPGIRRIAYPFWNGKAALVSINFWNTMGPLLWLSASREFLDGKNGRPAPHLERILGEITFSNTWGSQFRSLNAAAASRKAVFCRPGVNSTTGREEVHIRILPTALSQDVEEKLVHAVHAITSSLWENSYGLLWSSVPELVASTEWREIIKLDLGFRCHPLAMAHKLDAREAEHRFRGWARDEEESSPPQLQAAD